MYFSSTGIHWLHSTQNNLSRSPAKLCQTTSHSSCLKPTMLPVWLAASSCCKRYSLTSYGLGMKSVYRQTTIQLAERSVYALINNKKWYIDPSRLLRRSVMASVAVSQVGITTDIWQPWGEGERPVLLQCLAVSADASSNQTCRRTLLIHKTICCLWRNWSFLVFCDFPR